MNPFEGKEEKATEFKLHMAIKKHYESCFIGGHNPNLKLMHIANEQRDATQGYWNKVLGVEAGFPDILGAWPDGVGVCEVKIPGKPLSSSQNRFMSWAQHIGWHIGIARSVQQFHSVMLKWGLKPAHHSILEPDMRSDDKKKFDSFDFYKP